MLIMHKYDFSVAVVVMFAQASYWQQVLHSIIVGIMDFSE